MNALTLHAPQDIRYESVPDAKLETPTDVLVKVDIAAICGSDLHPYFGREKGMDPGTIMGHEMVGTILEVGSAVRRFKKGDQVFSPFTTNCGACFYCKKGLTCRCVRGQLYGWVENGSGLQGVQAELARVPLADSTLEKIPPGVPPQEALLLGDILSTGYYAAQLAETGPETTTAIVGCGPVGLMAILGARERGATEIFAIDLVAERLDLARKWGAHALHAENDNPIDFIKSRTNGRGADAVMELVGSPITERLAFDLLRPGGVLAVAGVHTEKHFSFSPPQAYNKNLTYRTGRCPARSLFEKLIPLVQSRKYNLSSIFSHRFPLSEGARGYHLFADKREKCTKVLLCP